MCATYFEDQPLGGQGNEEGKKEQHSVPQRKQVGRGTRSQVVVGSIGTVGVKILLVVEVSAIRVSFI